MQEAEKLVGLHPDIPASAVPAPRGDQVKTADQEVIPLQRPQVVPSASPDNETLATAQAESNGWQATSGGNALQGRMLGIVNVSDAGDVQLVGNQTAWRPSMELVPATSAPVNGTLPEDARLRAALERAERAERALAAANAAMVASLNASSLMRSNGTAMALGLLALNGSTSASGRAAPSRVSYRLPKHYGSQHTLLGMPSTSLSAPASKTSASNRSIPALPAFDILHADEQRAAEVRKVAAEIKAEMDYRAENETTVSAYEQKWGLTAAAAAVANARTPEARQSGVSDAKGAKKAALMAETRAEEALTLAKASLMLGKSEDTAKNAERVGRNLFKLAADAAAEKAVAQRTAAEEKTEELATVPNLEPIVAPRNMPMEAEQVLAKKTITLVGSAAEALKLAVQVRTITPRPDICATNPNACMRCFVDWADRRRDAPGPPPDRGSRASKGLWRGKAGPE